MWGVGCFFDWVFLKVLKLETTLNFKQNEPGALNTHHS